MSTAEETTGRKADLLRKVRGLLDKAERTTFEPEAAAFRAKADELMTLYAIEAWELEHSGQQAKSKPEKRMYDFTWYWENSLKDSLWRLYLALATHCRVLPVHNRVTNMMPVIGMSADLDYFDLLFTSLHLQFSLEMWPKYDPQLSEQENIYRMKNAGYKWITIAELIGRHECIENGKVKNGSILISQYRRACKEHGTEPVGINPTTYARSFAAGFVAAVKERLREQSEARDSDRMALVVRDTKEKLYDAMYEIWPELRFEKSNLVRTEGSKTDYAAYGSGRAAGYKADITGQPGRGVKSQRSLNQ